MTRIGKIDNADCVMKTPVTRCEDIKTGACTDTLLDGEPWKIGSSGCDKFESNGWCSP
jgi:hypothetical protein